MLNSIQGECQEIKPLFGRDLPPEAEPARAGDGGLNRGLLSVVDRAALGCPDSVVADLRLAVPGSVSTQSPPQVPCVEAFTSGRHNGKMRDTAGHASVLISAHNRNVPSISTPNFYQSQ